VASVSFVIAGKKRQTSAPPARCRRSRSGACARVRATSTAGLRRIRSSPPAPSLDASGRSQVRAVRRQVTDLHQLNRCLDRRSLWHCGSCPALRAPSLRTVVTAVGREPVGVCQAGRAALVPMRTAWASGADERPLGLGAERRRIAASGGPPRESGDLLAGSTVKHPRTAGPDNHAFISPWLTRSPPSGCSWPKPTTCA
jgi:hypothetical protein